MNIMERTIEAVRKRNPYNMDDAILNSKAKLAKKTWNDCCNLFETIFAAESRMPYPVSTERGNISLVMDIIKNGFMEAQADGTFEEKKEIQKKEIPIKDIKKQAMKEGMSEKDFIETLDKLEREGMLFKPCPDHVQRV